MLNWTMHRSCNQKTIERSLHFDSTTEQSTIKHSLTHSVEYQYDFRQWNSPSTHHNTAVAAVAAKQQQQEIRDAQACTIEFVFFFSKSRCFYFALLLLVISAYAAIFLCEIESIYSKWCVTFAILACLIRMCIPIVLLQPSNNTSKLKTILRVTQTDRQAHSFASTDEQNVRLIRSRIHKTISRLLSLSFSRLLLQQFIFLPCIIKHIQWCVSSTNCGSGRVDLYFVRSFGIDEHKQ